MLTHLIQNTWIRHYAHPSMMFCIANIFAFAQGNMADTASRTAFILIVGTFAVAFLFHSLVLFERTRPVAQRINAMAITATGVLLSGILALWGHNMLAGLAGLVFAAGNYLVAFATVQKMEKDADVSRLKRTFANPTIYFGIGYACIGLMAGGFETIPSTITTVLGIGITTLSSLGLYFRKFQSPAAPFVALGIGTGINMLSGLLTGNILGLLNNFFAMTGVFGLAYTIQKETGAQENISPNSPTQAKGLWGQLSHLLTIPATGMVKHFSIR